MMDLVFVPEGLSQFFESGGTVLWVILAVAILLWTLIIERYWYIKLEHPRLLCIHLTEWGKREDKVSWYARSIRAALLSKISLELMRFLPTIRVLIVLCPLLGLVGTVTGMIHVFDAVAREGTSNAKAVADGVSLATIPTLAGLVTALSGYYFSMRLKQHADSALQRASDNMVEDL
jgi:biopolymer transport protein ExbB